MLVSTAESAAQPLAQRARKRRPAPEPTLSTDAQKASVSAAKEAPVASVAVHPRPDGGLTPAQLEAFHAELEAIRQRVMATRGERDARYVRRVRTAMRLASAAGRLTLVAGWLPPAWLAGSALLGIAKILENMELGHNVMHGQYDWMNDPEFCSTRYEWNAQVTADGWRRCHNHEHHMYTNVVGKDRDLGYTAFRVCEEQTWHWWHVGQPLYVLLGALSFESAVAFYELELERVVRGERTLREAWPQIEPTLRKTVRQIAKDYLIFPLLSGPSFLPALTGNAAANLMRNVWAAAIIFCGHFTEDIEVFPESILESETKAEWYLRQLKATSNIEGGPLFHVLAGNLSFQIEHHLFPDLPANRYAEISGDVRKIAEKYGVRYNTGSFGRQLRGVFERLVRHARPPRDERPLGVARHRKVRTTEEATS